MKRTGVCLNSCFMIVAFVISAFCAGPVVDFDGTGDKIADITPRINEIKPDILAPTAVPPEKMFPVGELLPFSIRSGGKPSVFNTTPDNGRRWKWRGA